MLIDRRKALVSITVALFGRVAWGGSRKHPVSALGESNASTGSPGAVPGKDLARHDLAQIGKHVYSEEGIPMFLGCENTVSIGVSTQTCQRPSDLNRKVSAAFEHYAQEWALVHPHAKARDAAKIVEFLAGRDFTSGGLEAGL